MWFSHKQAWLFYDFMAKPLASTLKKTAIVTSPTQKCFSRDLKKWDKHRDRLFHLLLFNTEAELPIIKLRGSPFCQSEGRSFLRLAAADTDPETETLWDEKIALKMCRFPYVWTPFHWDHTGSSVNLYILSCLFYYFTGELHSSQKVAWRFCWSVLTPIQSVRPPTSKVKDSTTSDLDSVFSSSWPMSMMEVLWPRFSFCSLNSPPLDTGMLSKFAIRRFTDERSSSTYIASISLEVNLGNLPPCWSEERIADLRQTFKFSPLFVKLTRAIWSAICSRPSSSLLIWAACSSGLSSCRSRAVTRSEFGKVQKIPKGV